MAANIDPISKIQFIDESLGIIQAIDAFLPMYKTIKGNYTSLLDDQADDEGIKQIKDSYNALNAKLRELCADIPAAVGGRRKSRRTRNRKIRKS
jgi:hypothetical protein